MRPRTLVVAALLSLIVSQTPGLAYRVTAGRPRPEVEHAVRVSARVQMGVRPTR